MKDYPYPWNSSLTLHYTYNEANRALFNVYLHSPYNLQTLTEQQCTINCQYVLFGDSTYQYIIS